MSCAISSYSGGTGEGTEGESLAAGSGILNASHQNGSIGEAAGDDGERWIASLEGAVFHDDSHGGVEDHPGVLLLANER